MGLFSFNPVDPTEVSLRGFVSEHSKRRVPHSLRRTGERAESGSCNIFEEFLEETVD